MLIHNLNKNHREKFNFHINFTSKTVPFTFEYELHTHPLLSKCYLLQTN